MDLLHFGEPAYWELRYQEEFKKMIGVEFFDWYASYEDVHQILESIVDLKIPHKTLIIGLGRSNIIDVLYKKGFREITAIDISPTLVSTMKNKYRDLAGVEFFVMDARNLHEFSNDSFSLVIDKGCGDAIFCGGDLYESYNRLCQEVYRVLRPGGGVFAMISHAAPAARVPYLRSVPWAVDSCLLPNSEEPTLYLLTKTDDPKLLAHKVAGGEAYVRESAGEDKNIYTQADLQRGPVKLAGKVKVNANVEMLLRLVREAEDKEVEYDYYSEDEDMSYLS